MSPLRRVAAAVMTVWTALTLLRRLRRGEVVVLSQYGAPVVRLLAIALVFLASCAEKLRPAPPQSQSQSEESEGSEGSVAPATTPEVVVADGQTFPEALDDGALQRAYNWIAPRSLHQHFSGEEGGAPSPPLPAPGGLDDALRRPAATLAAAITAHLGGAVAAADLLALLDAAEAAGVHDGWLAGHLWRHARTLRPAPAELFGRLERHLRIVHALTLAQASTGPIEFSAWRSKAGPPPGWQRLQVPPGLAAAAREAFKQGADAGTWESEATLELRVARGELTLVRRGVELRVGAGSALRLRRLDVVRAPAGAALQHATLGELALPAGAELTAWNVAQFLDAAGRAWVAARVRAALDGESAALTELERALPAAHAAIRAAIAEATARGAAERAASLQIVLQAFDE